MYKKRVTVFLFSLCISILSIGYMYANSTEKHIRVGYSETINTIIFDINSFNSIGYGYEVFKKIEEVSDYTFDFIPIKGDMFEAINDGIVDIAGLNIKTPEREKNLAFSNIQYSKTYASLATNEMDIYYNDAQAIDGKTVATYPDNLAQDYLDRYCSFYDISVTYEYGTLENYMDLDTDFYITYSQHEKAVDKNNVLNLGVYNLYLTSSLENRDLLHTLDTIFYDIVATEGNYFLELEEKYLGKYIELNHRSLTRKEVELLRQRPLDVGYIANYAPISFINEQGVAEGAMIEVLNMFAERYDFEVNYHPYKIDDSHESHQYYDMLVTIYGNGEHDFQYYTPTEPYYIIPLFAQVHSEDINGIETFYEVMQKPSKIGMLQYQAVDYDNFLQAYPNSEIIFYYDWHELLDDFATKKLDVMISTESSTNYAELYLENVDKVTLYTDLVVPMQFLISNTIAEDYAPIFNIIFDNVSENEYRNILNKNSNSFYPKTTIIDIILDNIAFFVMLVIFIVFVFSIFAYQQRAKRKEGVAHAYNTDVLTGLIALHKFTEIIDKTLKNAKPGEYELISFDMDMFKTINTHYSNERGTEVILSISNALKKAFKNSDAYITRRTADQFIILRKINECGEISSIYNTFLLPNIRGAIGERYSIAMSFGNVIIENCKEKSSSIIGHADSARILGKNKHETTFITFDSSMKKLYENKINVTFRMENALKNKEFVVVYQPKIDFNTLKVGGSEALVRWRPKVDEQIFPDAFIPVFEENGFIYYLDTYVFEEVCSFIKENSQKMDIPRISVNFSAFTVLSEKTMPTISDIVVRYGINPNLIELEVTETAVVSDETKFLQKVKELKSLGFLVSIDDFGAGVSSLNRLSTIEADILKLDKAFFSLTNAAGVKSNIIVSDVISMAKHLNMLVVAEGVETIDQAVWLRGINCDYAQGYYFERPMEKDAFTELLQSDKTYELKY